MYQLICELNLDKSQTIPKSWCEKLADLMLDGEKPLFAAATDLNLEGKYDQQWAIVTDKRLYTIRGLSHEAKDKSKAKIDKATDNEEIAIEVYPLKDTERVDNRVYYGVGAIEITDSEGRREVLRYTRRYRRKFLSFTSYLNRAIEGQVFDIVEDLSAAKEGVQGEGRCPNCSTPFKRGTSSCPKCSSKAETFKRLLGYLKPYKGKVALMLTTTFVFTLLNLIPPLLQKVMIDDVITKLNLGPIKVDSPGYLCCPAT